MKIKLSQTKHNNSLSQRKWSQKKQSQSPKNTNDGIVFQEQFNSIQNYFNLLHHIFGRNKQVKDILKISPKMQQESSPVFKISIQSINEESNQKLGNEQLKEDRIKDSSKRLVQLNGRQQTQRPKWKQNILRRKNNGSHGEIFKGNPKIRYSSVISKAVPDRKDNNDPPTQNFIPLGTLRAEESKNMFPFNSLEPSAQDYKKIKFDLRNKMRKQSILRKQIRTQCKQQTDQDYMSRTCFPMNPSDELKDNHSLVRKVIMSTPYRHKSRISTPCPWEYTSQDGNKKHLQN